MKQPQFWINPNTRLRFPQFCLEWQACDKTDLLGFCKMDHPRRKTYLAGTTCIHLIHSEDYSRLYILYYEGQNFENLRLQKWLRESIRDTITARAAIALPLRLHELENKHQLWAKGVTVKKLRKGKASLLNMSIRAALHSVLDDKLFVQQKILWLQDAPAAVRRALHTFNP